MLKCLCSVIGRICLLQAKKSTSLPFEICPDGTDFNIMERFDLCVFFCFNWDVFVFKRNMLTHVPSRCHMALHIAALPSCSLYQP